MVDLTTTQIFARLHRIERELRKVQCAPACPASLEMELRRIIDLLELDHERLFMRMFPDRGAPTQTKI